MSRRTGDPADADAVGHAFRSILEALDEARPAGGLGFTRICDLHTEFTTQQMKSMLRYLEGEFLIIKSKPDQEGELGYWTSSDGSSLLRRNREMDWWRFAKVYLGI